MQKRLLLFRFSMGILQIQQLKKYIHHSGALDDGPCHRFERVTNVYFTDCEKRTDKAILICNESEMYALSLLLNFSAFQIPSLCCISQATTIKNFSIICVNFPSVLGSIWNETMIMRCIHELVKSPMKTWIRTRNFIWLRTFTKQNFYKHRSTNDAQTFAKHKWKRIQKLSLRKQREWERYENLCAQPLTRAHSLE